MVTLPPERREDIGPHVTIPILLLKPFEYCTLLAKRVTRIASGVRTLHRRQRMKNNNPLRGNEQASSSFVLVLLTTLALAESLRAGDAFVVKTLREAGALILAKANLTELARGGTTVSSLGRQTRNPYDLTRTPGGSSGGTGAAIAASFGIAGTGSDTGQSVRSPASAQSLVGLRPTRGLISRSGIIPLSTTQDEAGPITRTVEDAARMLDVIAGYDPADPVTAFGAPNIPKTYTAFLNREGLKGARIGVLTDFFGREGVHEEVNAVTETAI